MRFEIICIAIKGACNMQRNLSDICVNGVLLRALVSCFGDQFIWIAADAVFFWKIIQAA